MSAPARSIFPIPSSELSATALISHLGSAAQRYDVALDAILSAVLNVAGVWRVSIELPPELAEHLTMERMSRSPRRNWGSAIAPLEAGLYNWGQLRICFELSSDVSESPLRFTKYVAQQIAALLDRLALQDQRNALRQQVSALTRRLETKKAVVRAMGLLTQHHRLSARAALAQIVSLARRHGRGLSSVAQSVILLESDDAGSKSPKWRRLSPNETAGPRSHASRTVGL